MRRRIVSLSAGLLAALLTVSIASAGGGEVTLPTIDYDVDAGHFVGVAINLPLGKADVDLGDLTDQVDVSIDVSTLQP